MSVDRSLFLFLNGLHCSFLDPVMYYGTRTVLWLPLYILFLYAVIRRHRWQAIRILICAMVMIIASDQLSNIFKDFVARPRPSHEPGLTGIHLVRGYTGGQFGFYSAHASTTLAIAIFLISLLGKRCRFFTPSILFWAFFMSFTRIYLGVHYPSDILAGWLAGGLIGWGASRACRMLIDEDRHVAGRSSS